MSDSHHYLALSSSLAGKSTDKIRVVTAVLSLQFVTAVCTGCVLF